MATSVSEIVGLYKIYKSSNLKGFFFNPDAKTTYKYVCVCLSVCVALCGIVVYY